MRPADCLTHNIFSGALGYGSGWVSRWLAGTESWNTLNPFAIDSLSGIVMNFPAYLPLLAEDLLTMDRTPTLLGDALHALRVFSLTVAPSILAHWPEYFSTPESSFFAGTILAIAGASTLGSGIRIAQEINLTSDSQPAAAPEPQQQNNADLNDFMTQVAKEKVRAAKEEAAAKVVTPPTSDDDQINFILRNRRT